MPGVVSAAGKFSNASPWAEVVTSRLLTRRSLPGNNAFKASMSMDRSAELSLRRVHASRVTFTGPMWGGHGPSGRRQSMPAISIDRCAHINTTLPLTPYRQTKRLRSSRFTNRHRPSPLHHCSLIMLSRRPRNRNAWPLNGSSASAVSSFAARAFMLERMPETSAARLILLPTGNSIMAEKEPVALLASPGRPNPPGAAGCAAH